MSIHYSKLTGFQELFVDYLYKFDKVENFYNEDFRDTGLYQGKFEKITSINRDHREDLTNILADQYKDFPISEETEFNIKSFALQNTVAIVTGQQAGICGGPLYTIYKAITAIKLAEKFKKEFPEFIFVPVFWMEVDDHDFDEIASINLVDQKNIINKLEYSDGQPEDVNRGSISSIKLNKEVDTFINSLSNSLRDTEYKEQIINLLSSAYKEGKSIAAAFREVLVSIFDKYGLVIVDPSDSRIKEILKPVFIKEIENFQSHSDALLARSAELEEGYHAQVKVKPINLFMTEDDGGRYLIEPVDNEFRLKGKRKRISKEELLEKLDSSPDKFSPNVLLRPVCQDYLFPTAFYIAGPGEISYFAQVTKNYELYNIEQPFIFPRASATIVEKHISSLMEKYNLTFDELTRDEKVLKTQILSAASVIDIDNLFDESEKVVKLLMEKLSEELVSIDESLSDGVNKSLAKMTQALHSLKMRSESANERSNETTVRQLVKMKSNLFPTENYQERVFNWIHFVNRYGFDFFDWLYDELSIEDRNHQIIEL